MGVFVAARDEQKEEGKEQEKKNVEEEDEDDEEEEEESVPGSTLFIKNLNFSTTEQTLQEVLGFLTASRVFI